MVQMNLFTKQKQSHRGRKQPYGFQGGKGRDKLGDWDWSMQTITFRMDKQQGPNVQHWEMYSVSCDKP